MADGRPPGRRGSPAHGGGLRLHGRRLLGPVYVHPDTADVVVRLGRAIGDPYPVTGRRQLLDDAPGHKHPGDGQVGVGQGLRFQHTARAHVGVRF
jgi:hypothetical protein